tara:strand:+ start:3958 stop:4440 length:483 start_codon:yes stop_codon:yes gene_type:complete
MSESRLYGKLVRDKIPAIIEERGQRAVCRVVSESEMLLRLNLKLKEELDEVVQARTLVHQVEELADLIEVVYGYVDYIGSTKDELERVRVAKFDKRGGYVDRQFLISVEDALSEKEVQKREEEEVIARALANPMHRDSQIHLQVGDETVSLNVNKLKEIE